MIEIVWYLSLSIVVASAAVIALHHGIPKGFIGTTALGGVAVFGMAGFDQSPPDWLVGFVTSLAWVCVWGWVRWRSTCTRRTLDVVTKPGRLE